MGRTAHNLRSGKQTSTYVLWLGRMVVSFALVAPFIGALGPIIAPGAVATLVKALLAASELKLIARTAGWACVMTFVTLVLCLVAAPVFLALRSHDLLRRLCALLTATFFIPAILKAYAFYWFWNRLGLADASSSSMIVLWSITYYSVFFWGCVYIFATTPENRSTLDALAELQTLAQTGPVLARILAPSILLASICTLMFCMFGGMEYSLFTRGTVHSIGEVLGGLFGVRDTLAAQVSLALLVLLGTVLGLFLWLTERTGSAARLIDR